MDQNKKDNKANMEEDRSSYIFAIPDSMYGTSNVVVCLRWHLGTALLHSPLNPQEVLRFPNNSYPGKQEYAHPTPNSKPFPSLMPFSIGDKAGHSTTESSQRNGCLLHTESDLPPCQPSWGPLYLYSTTPLKTLRPRQNRRRFADDTFKPIFSNDNARISTKISLKFVPEGPINNIPALSPSGDKPLSEPMMVSLLTHIYVTRPQWFKKHTAIQMQQAIILEAGTSVVECSGQGWHMSPSTPSLYWPMGQAGWNHIGQSIFPNNNNRGDAPQNQKI